MDSRNQTNIVNIPKSSQFYDVVAGQFEEEYYGDDADPVVAFDVEELRIIIRTVVSDNSRILEIGSGTGYWLQYLRMYRNCDVYGLDFSMKMVKECASRGINTCVVADASGIPFPDEFFDFVISPFNALNHCQEYRRAFGEIHRILKPGGRIFLMLDNSARRISTYWKTTHPRVESIGLDPADPTNWIHKVDGKIIRVFCKFFSEDEVRELLKGFDIDIRGLGSFLPLLPRCIRDQKVIGRACVWFFASFERLANRYYWKKSAFFLVIGKKTSS